MTLDKFIEILNSLELPYAYYFFPIGKAPALPYFVYYFPDQDADYADDIPFCQIKTINIELYSKEKDFELEKRFEEILIKNELNFTKTESYLDSEKMYEVLYEMEEIING